MVAGHLQIKKGYYYAVLSWNSGEKKKNKMGSPRITRKGEQAQGASGAGNNTERICHPHRSK